MCGWQGMYRSQEPRRLAFAMCAVRPRQECGASSLHPDVVRIILWNSVSHDGDEPTATPNVRRTMRLWDGMDWQERFLQISLSIELINSAFHNRQRMLKECRDLGLGPPAQRSFLTPLDAYAIRAALYETVDAFCPLTLLGAERVDAFGDWDRKIRCMEVADLFSGPTMKAPAGLSIKEVCLFFSFSH